MEILLVAATLPEIKPFLESNGLKEGFNEFNGVKVEVMITGAGMVPTAFCLGKLHSRNFDLVVNAGIAGAFSRLLALGEVVEVTEDTFAELGAEDGEQFIPIDQLGFGQAVFRPVKTALTTGLNTGLKSVSAITVNKVHGNESTITDTLSRCNAAIESMEGAAFFYACQQYQFPCIQVRAISNYVERRNRETWNIPLAIKNLTHFLNQLLIKLQ